jgi:hypothetical protein
MEKLGPAFAGFALRGYGVRYGRIQGVTRR